MFGILFQKCATMDVTLIQCTNLDVKYQPTETAQLLLELAALVSEHHHTQPGTTLVMCRSVPSHENILQWTATGLSLGGGCIVIASCHTPSQSSYGYLTSSKVVIQ